MKRWDIIQSLIDKYELTSYLEIGVHQKECFNKIQCELKHCVDPNFPADYEMTSDNFFWHNCEQGYDLIFIDGLHTAEQTWKDITHALEILDGGGFVVVHDCNPATIYHTRPPEEYNRGEEWNGTTYKAFIQFKQQHPELTCFTIDTDYGCGVITKRFNKKIIPVTWEEFDANRTELLGLKSVEEFKKLI